MKRILLLLPLLAACGVQGTDMPPIGMAATPAAVEDTCGAARFSYLVGQAREVALGTALPEGTRIIGPGDVPGDEVRPDRLNVRIDGNVEVDEVFCG